MRFGRNLTSWEILDQALHFRRREPVNHTVYMGMGEPFLSHEPVVESARLLPDLGITHRRTTISTVGWLPGLRRFVDGVTEPIRLALSLHAADPGLRSELMPVNDRYPLDAVLAECRRYVALRRRKVFVEYVMLAGVNDTPAAARTLAAVLDARSFKVNLIPYNPTGLDNKGSSYEGSSREAPTLQERPPPRRYSRDSPTHARAGYRSRLRAARRHPHLGAARRRGIL